MNCRTCKHYGESPISGMCEGCVNCEKHSERHDTPQNRLNTLQDKLNTLLDKTRSTKEYKREKRILELEKENADLKDQITEYEDLIKLQRKRSAEADKLWQQAHNRPNVWPDLGQLLTWLLSQIKGAKCCESCKHVTYDGENYDCTFQLDRDCSPPDFQLWGARDE